MPIYEYQCDACGHADSFLESMNAASNKTCPKCGKRRVFKRLISAAGFQLKGQGWYATDFKTKVSKKEKTEDRDDGKKTENNKKKASDTNTSPADKKADNDKKPVTSKAND